MDDGWRSFPRGDVDIHLAGVGDVFFLRVDCRLVPQKTDGYYLYTCCCIRLRGVY
jgi:hypothetical protein